MIVPGSNLLGIAMTVLGRQTVTYFVDDGRTTNAIGLDVTDYDNGIPVSGSFQPVPRNKYEAYGLDWQRTYFTFYASIDSIDLARDVSGDQLVFSNRRFQVVSKVDWFMMDGWDAILCVEIGKSC